MNKPFKFKQFTIQQDRCAMKIGTDGVLLGGWVAVQNNPETILDIGTGTGIIALMLAQKTAAPSIDALEIDEDAYEQAVENFENSDWGDRLFCYHAAFDEFVEEMQEEELKYDLIVSNPPFHAEMYASKNLQRDKARFAASLPFEELLEGVSKLLCAAGKFNVILPKKEKENFLQIAEEYKLYPHRITEVKGNPQTPVKRNLMEFSFKKINFKPEILVIENSRHNYTKEYKNLVSNFYLKM